MDLRLILPSQPGGRRRRQVEAIGLFGHEV